MIVHPTFDRPLANTPCPEIQTTGWKIGITRGFERTGAEPSNTHLFITKDHDSLPQSTSCHPFLLQYKRTETTNLASAPHSPRSKSRYPHEPHGPRQHLPPLPPHHPSTPRGHASPLRFHHTSPLPSPAQDPRLPVRRNAPASPSPYLHAGAACPGAD